MWPVPKYIIFFAVMHILSRNKKVTHWVNRSILPRTKDAIPLHDATYLKCTFSPKRSNLPEKSTYFIQVDAIPRQLREAF